MHKVLINSLLTTNYHRTSDSDNPNVVEDEEVQEGASPFGLRPEHAMPTPPESTATRPMTLRVRVQQWFGQTDSPRRLRYRTTSIKRS